MHKISSLYSLCQIKAMIDFDKGNKVSKQGLGSLLSHLVNPGWYWDLSLEQTETLSIKMKINNIMNNINEVYLFTFWSWWPHGTLGSLMALQRQK